jgi:hypothetical protein
MDTHVQIAFRNPIAEQVPHRANLLRDVTYALQAYDAVNSNRCFTLYRCHETDPAYKFTQHTGALGILGGYLLANAALHGAVNALHLGSAAHTAVDAWQGGAAIYGISKTNAFERNQDRR